MTEKLMTALDLPSGYPELILRWATSQANHFSINEYGDDYWHTWRSTVVEQLQENLLCYLDGMSDEILYEVCQIVINTLR